MTVEVIIAAIKADHGGAWWALFHPTNDGHRFLPTGHTLTPAQYTAVVRAFAAPQIEKVGDLSPEDRKRNNLQAKAVAKHG